MTISKDNTRTQLTISKDLKKQLGDIAKEQNRSFNNLIITILKDYIENSSHDWNHGLLKTNPKHRKYPIF